MKVQSVRYTPGGGSDLVDIEVGEPGRGEVQIEVAACGICSWDLATFKAGSDSKYAAPPGHEGVGYVTKIGEGVRGFEIGDRVAGGGFQQVRNMHVRSVYKIPDSNFEDHHWVVEPASCVVTGIDHCNLKAGERLAMVGCGFMGLMMIQGLKGMGADQLVALDVDQSRLDLALEQGATEAWNVADDGFEDVLADLRTRNFDVVVDTTGAQPGLDLATDIVKRGGKINLFGWLKGEVATFNPSTWHGKGITIVNSSPSAAIRDPFPPAIRLMEKGIIDLKPLVTHVVPLEEYASFMQGVTSGEVGGYIKGVVRL